MAKKNSGMDTHLLSASQRSTLTEFSRNGTMNMENRKPYRTKEQKRIAKATTRKDKDGAFRSTAPVSYHGKEGKKRRAIEEAASD